MGGSHFKRWLLPTAVHLWKAVWSGCTDYKEKAKGDWDFTDGEIMIDKIKIVRLNGDKKYYRMGTDER